METSCMTRAVEVLKYLRRTVPKTIPRSSLDALETVPPAVLSSLHIASDWEHVTQDAKLKDWLHTHAIPAPQASKPWPYERAQ